MNHILDINSLIIPKNGRFCITLHVFHDFSACEGGTRDIHRILQQLPEALQAFVGPGIPASRLTGDQDGIYVSHGPVVSKAGLCHAVPCCAKASPAPAETT